MVLVVGVAAKVMVFVVGVVEWKIAHAVHI
jgi:hypothetical protein